MMLSNIRKSVFSFALGISLPAILFIAGCTDETQPTSAEVQRTTVHAAKAGTPPQSGRPVPTDPTPLVIAIRDYDIERFVALLDAGGNVNEQDDNWYSLLHHAAGAGRYEMVQILIDRGADLNIRGRLNVTPLHWAVRFNHLETVQLLVEAGAELNARGGTGEGFTPLGLAVQTNYVDIVDYLLTVGAEM